jgi:hypothetical protein
VWRVSRDRVTQNDLGPSNLEALRVYLLGVAPFPGDAALSVQVFDDDDLYPFTHWPEASNQEGYDQHVFGIPGFEFHLFLGGAMPESMRNIRHKSPFGTVFYLESFRKTRMFEALRESARGADPKGKLKELYERNRPN